MSFVLIFGGLVIKKLLLLVLGAVAGHHRRALIPIYLLGRFQQFHQGGINAFVYFFPAGYLNQVYLVVFRDSVFVVHQQQIPVGVTGRWGCVFS